jgi:hypothetical protein
MPPGMRIRTTMDPANTRMGTEIAPMAWGTPTIRILMPTR